ncbi:MAG: hypothetical protein WC725_05005 [Patescibacteria group bacterium]|jgi:hypothetical protein
MKNLIHSGGALGADSIFGDIGIANNYSVAHHSFYGHTCNGAGTRIIHSASELALADNALIKANATLKRFYPPKSAYVQKLLQRNYYQILNSQFVVAIATINKYTDTVNGGTGWATQMAVDMQIPVYVFDCADNKWYKKLPGTKFTPCSLSDVPNTGVFAGIGSREITPQGREQIRLLLES